MPQGDAFEIAVLPQGYYRLWVISSSADWKNTVDIVNLSNRQPIAKVDNREVDSARFTLDADTPVRVAHFYRDDNRGSIKLVTDGLERSELTYFCEDWRDADYNDIRVRLTRYEDQQYERKIPIFGAPGAGAVAASGEVTGGNTEVSFPADLNSCSSVHATANGYKYNTMDNAVQGPLFVKTTVDVPNKKLKFEVWDTDGSPYNGNGWGGMEAKVYYLVIGS